MGYDKAAMDQAAKVAAKDLLDHLQGVDELGPGDEAMLGAVVVIRWLDRHYRTAGYRRLCRFLLQELLPKIDAGEF